ncbi:MAG: ATP-binding protein [Bacteroidales bacterium]|nr:ATP-binding protein [Bacteroidales bacterium]MCF8337064.1 ATP-binding protein [Bacteroidales bacterium]
MKNRRISAQIRRINSLKTGRIIVLTGARQTGKTTLIRRLFPDYQYISIEDPVMRSNYRKLTAQQWSKLYPFAVLDEIQKEPELIESIKSVYDQFEMPRYILLGSSQLLLMEKVRESLAGRSNLLEVYPLTLPELKTESWDDPIEDSLFQKELLSRNTTEYLPTFHLDNHMTEKQKAWEHLMHFGSYPAVSDPELSEEEKFNWLTNYVKTYLERDIRDLAAFRDLEPFLNLQRYVAINTATLINASDMGRKLGITTKTVQRYLRYFELSYQSVIIPAWAQNLNKRLSKMPKIHFLDQGIIQAILQKKGGLTGYEFESLIVSELFKQMRTIGEQRSLYHLHTHDGKEIDLLIEFPEYYYAFEIKMTEKISNKDARHLKGLDKLLNKPVKKAFILSNDPETQYFSDNIIAIHAAMFLG